MKISKSLIVRIIIIIAIIVVTSVIFLNSSENIATSQQSSNAVIDVIVPNQNAENNKQINFLVRKAAHLFEFALLGALVMSLILNIKKAFKKHFFGNAFFYVLAVAVIDEHIQSFYERTSSTSDILLDFLGALIGFAIILILKLIINKLKSLLATK
ncbi:MAG: hypothetical protein E7480_00400 [Ruminococcaceae bacterium]|nr:hypothetical protein [Oscillospiraceae bacterium]